MRYWALSVIAVAIFILAWIFRYEPITPGNELVWDRWLHRTCVSMAISQGWGCYGENIPEPSEAQKLKDKLRAAGFSDKEIDDYFKEHPPKP
jgi:hypothetical protein